MPRSLGKGQTMSDAATKSEPRNQIGDRYVLFLVHWSRTATRDGAGRPHDGWVVSEEIPVTVTEQRQVSGMFGNGEYTGIKATSEDGREFTRFWNSYPDDAYVGVGMVWDAYADGRGRVQEVHDACLAHYWRRVAGPQCDAEGKLKIPTGTVQCNRHDDIYLPEMGCMHCRLDELVGNVRYIKCPHCDVERAVDDLPAQRRHMQDEHPAEVAAIEEANKKLDGWADA